MNSGNDNNYKNIKLNVDNLKLIQIGITLANEKGEMPMPYSTWQFNFKFNLEYLTFKFRQDSYLFESINLLQLAGIDFSKFLLEGIEVENFAEVFITSGLVLNENVKWITFHGSYDFAYFVKALSNQPLPENETLFNEMLTLYFCNYYDTREMAKNVSWLKGSLSKIANDLEIKRIGTTHQAGSDSLVTSKIFFKLLTFFQDYVDIYNYKNKLFGINYKPQDEQEWKNFNYYNNVPFMIPITLPNPNFNQNFTNQMKNTIYIPNMNGINYPPISGTSSLMNSPNFQMNFNGFSPIFQPVDTNFYNNYYSIQNNPYNKQNGNNGDPKFVQQN